METAKHAVPDKIFSPGQMAGHNERDYDMLVVFKRQNQRAGLLLLQSFFSNCKPRARKRPAGNPINHSTRIFDPIP